MNKNKNDWFVGILLVALGLIFLLNQFFEIPLFENLAVFFLFGLGVIFLAWGVVSRSDGLMIPGGILSGIGLGTVLVTSFDGATEDLDGALFMGAFALGWVVITVFTALFTERTHWWPLIPAAIMALVSAALLVEGPFMVALDLLGKLWPLTLIIGGIALLLGAKRIKGGKEKEIPTVEDIDIDQLKKEEG